MDALIERYCKKLKLSGLYKGYKDIEFKNKEQFIHDLLRIEIEEREINKLKLRTKIKTMNLENSIIDRLIICFRHIKQAFPLKLLAKPLKMLLKNCQFAHWMLI